MAIQTDAFNGDFEMNQIECINLKLSNKMDV